MIEFQSRERGKIIAIENQCYSPYQHIEQKAPKRHFL